MSCWRSRSAKRFGDFLRDGNGTRIGQVAIVQARAGDDVGDQARHWAWRSPSCFSRAKIAGRSFLRTCGSTRFCSWLTRISPMAEFVHQIGQRIHLLDGCNRPARRRWASAKSSRWHSPARDGRGRWCPPNSRNRASPSRHRIRRQSRLEFRRRKIGRDARQFFGRHLPACPLCLISANSRSTRVRISSAPSAVARILMRAL